MKTIIANPPFSASWNADKSCMQDERFFEYGKLAPKSKADFAFVQDMIHKLDKNGIMAVVLPHGVLFRGSTEGHIRRYLIEKKNYLDAIIGLPANIFYGTSIPTCVLIFKKDRNEDDGILFIDASKEFEKSKSKNLLTDENTDKIASTYHNREIIEKYSHLASLKELEENDYNLNIPRYVDCFEDEPEIDIHAVMDEIEQLKKQAYELDKQIDVYLKELGIK